MVTAILAIGIVSASSVRLEAKLSKPEFKFGEKIKIQIYAVNEGEKAVVIGKSAIGNFASGDMSGEVTYQGAVKPELQHYNPTLGQIMMGRTISVREDDYAVIPPKSRALVFFEDVSGEWKDGYTPWNVPSGLKAISIPARRGTYRFNYTYSFTRKKAQETLKNHSFRAGYNLDEHVIPDIKREIVFVKDARSLFNSAVEGTWRVSGEFKIA